MVSAIMNKDSAYANAVKTIFKMVKSGKLPVRKNTPPKARYVGAGTRTGIRKARMKGIENVIRILSLFK
jgi:hypothetical protein